MKARRLYLMSVFSTLLCIPTLSSATNNYPTTAPFPDTVYVQRNCGTMTNCGTTLADFQSWMDTYKQPSATKPLLVNIGPGAFGGSITCNGYSNLSIRGAGQQQTTINGNNNTGYDIRGTNCTNLNVQDLTLSTVLGVLSPASWQGTGSSTWINVTIEPVTIYAWTETACPSDPTQAPVHRWFSSRLGGLVKTYEAQCSDNWFFGSQLYVTAIGGDAKVLYAHAYALGPYTPMFHVYGSNITVTLPTGIAANPITSNGSGVFAVDAGPGSMVHIHGTGIDVTGNGSTNQIGALVSTGGMIHANNTAYNLDAGGGSIARIINFGGIIKAPYVWEQGSNPPSITSVTGADTAVITSTSDGHPHVVIYDSTCPSSWYDTVAHACH
jgi:hypothetical protein